MINPWHDINKIVMQDGSWYVMEGISVTDKNLFYYIIEHGGERLYCYIDKPKSSMLYKAFNSNCSKYLKDDRIPESIKDFIRSIVMLNEL